jgi:hypothetical protein
VAFQAHTVGARIVVEASGTTADGIYVGVLLRERAGEPTSLEIYMVGASTTRLPTPESLRVEPKPQAVSYEASSVKF